MSAWPALVAAVVPVYNHATRVGAVVRSLRDHGALVIAIDDGSTDNSGTVAATAGAEVIRIDRNRGKANALVVGLDAAAKRGYRSVVTIDADGQHAASDALRLAITSAAEPTALYIGVRDMRDAPWPSRSGRWCSNTAVRWCCGQATGDSQSGLRAYPLPATLTLGAHSVRFAWEVEIVVRAFRAGIRVVDMPVSVLYPSNRISHFGTVRDTARLCGVMARLVISRQ